MNHRIGINYARRQRPSKGRWLIFALAMAALLAGTACGVVGVIGAAFKWVYCGYLWSAPASVAEYADLREVTLLASLEFVSSSGGAPHVVVVPMDQSPSTYIAEITADPSFNWHYPTAHMVWVVSRRFAMPQQWAGTDDLDDGLRSALADAVAVLAARRRVEPFAATVFIGTNSRGQQVVVAGTQCRSGSGARYPYVESLFARGNDGKLVMSNEISFWAIRDLSPAQNRSICLLIVAPFVAAVLFLSATRFLLARWSRRQ